MQHCGSSEDGLYSARVEMIDDCCIEHVVTLSMLRMLVKEHHEDALKESFHKIGLRVLVKQAANDITAAEVMAKEGSSNVGFRAVHTTSMARSAQQGQGRMGGKGSESQPQPAAVAPVFNEQSTATALS